MTDGTEGAGLAGRPPGSRVLLGGRGRGPSIIAFRVVLLAASVVPTAGRGVEVKVRRAFLPVSWRTNPTPRSLRFLFSRTLLCSLFFSRRFALYPTPPCGFLVISAFFLEDPPSEVILLLLSVPIDGYGLCDWGAHT